MAQFGESFAGSFASGFRESFNPMIAMALQKKAKQDETDLQYIKMGMDSIANPALRPIFLNVIEKDKGKEAVLGWKTAFKASDEFGSDEAVKLLPTGNSDQLLIVGNAISRNDWMSANKHIAEFKQSNEVTSFMEGLNNQVQKLQESQMRYPQNAQPSGVDGTPPQFQGAYKFFSDKEGNEGVSIPPHMYINTLETAKAQAIAQRLPEDVIAYIDNKLNEFKSGGKIVGVVATPNGTILQRVGTDGKIEDERVVNPFEQRSKEAQATIDEAKAKTAKRTIELEQGKTEAEIRKLDAETAIMKLKTEAKPGTIEYNILRGIDITKLNKEESEELENFSQILLNIRNRYANAAGMLGAKELRAMQLDKSYQETIKAMENLSVKIAKKKEAELKGTQGTKEETRPLPTSPVAQDIVKRILDETKGAPFTLAQLNLYFKKYPKSLEVQDQVMKAFGFK